METNEKTPQVARENQPANSARIGSFHATGKLISGNGRAVEPVKERSTEETRPVCTNCGETLLGEYCFRCGQKRLPPDHLSMRHFVHETVVHVGDFEHTKIYRTLRALLLKPGLLTNEYIAARRVDWITPLKSFITIFAISFFLYSAFRSVAVYDLSTLLDLDPRGALRKALERLAAKRQVSVDAFVPMVNEKWRTYISASQFIYPPSFAIVLMAFYARQRRFFVEHLVFSTHYQTFALLVIVLMWPMYLLTGLALSIASAILSIAMTAVMIWYLIVAVRNVYRQSWLASSVKGVLLYASYYVLSLVVTYATLGLAIYMVMRRG